MRTRMQAFHFALQIFIGGILGSPALQAQPATVAGTIALRSGESTELTNIYMISHCKSVLRGTPEVEILEGPPGVTATIKQAMVLPRYYSCARPVPGGTLVLTAGDIEDPSYTRLVLRITYRTKDGDRRYSQVYNLSLMP